MRHVENSMRYGGGWSWQPIYVWQCRVDVHVCVLLFWNFKAHERQPACSQSFDGIHSVPSVCVCVYRCWCSCGQCAILLSSCQTKLTVRFHVSTSKTLLIHAEHQKSVSEKAMWTANITHAPFGRHYYGFRTLCALFIRLLHATVQGVKCEASRAWSSATKEIVGMAWICDEPR